MPLTELMNYFNDQLQSQVQAKSLPKTGFYKANNTYWARFGSLILGSQFQPIKRFDEEKVIGYEAELVARACTGSLLDINTIFHSLDSNDQIVHLDRLVRTLHSLNYLQNFDGQDYLLSLQVQPRHIVSVDDDHGKTFEIILSDCGLKPERVLLHTRLLDESTLKHFHKALSSYTNRSYKIAVSITEVRELSLLARLNLELDAIFVHHPASEWFTKPQLSNADAAYVEQLQIYSAKRIVVSKKSDSLEAWGSFYDGYLISQRELLNDIEMLKQVNYF